MSLVDVAKNGVELFLKIRSRCPEAKYDKYFLLTTHAFKNKRLVSTYPHPQSHLLYQLHNITCDNSCESSHAILDAFSLLNEYRVLFRNDDYFGGREVARIDNGLVIFFTDGTDPNAFTLLENKIGENEFCRWDQSLHIFNLNLMSHVDVSFKYNIPLAKKLEKICHELNGNLYCVDCFENLFFIMDRFVASLKHRVGIILEFNKVTSDKVNDITNKYLQSTNFIFEETTLVNNHTLHRKTKGFMCSLLARSTSSQIANRHILDANLHPHNNTLSRYPYPEDPFSLMKSKKNLQNYAEESRVKGSIEYAGFPIYFIDFTKCLTRKFNEELLPERFDLDESEFLRICCLSILQKNQNVDKIYFPVYLWNENTKQYVIFATLKLSRRPDGNPAGEFYLFCPDFITFENLVEDASRHILGMRPSNLLAFESYFASIPSYYQMYLSNFFSFKKFSFLLAKKPAFSLKGFSGQSFPYEMMNKLIWKIIKDKAHFLRENESITQKLKSQHDKDDAECCLPPTLRKLQGNKLLGGNVGATLNLYAKDKLTENILRFKEIILPKETADMQIEAMKREEFITKLVSRLSDYSENARRMQDLRNPNAEDVENRFVKEPMPFGNPFKLVVRTKVQKIGVMENMVDEAFLSAMEPTPSGKSSKERIKEHLTKRKTNEYIIGEENYRNMQMKKRQLEEVYKFKKKIDIKDSERRSEETGESSRGTKEPDMINESYEAEVELSVAPFAAESPYSPEEEFERERENAQSMIIKESTVHEKKPKEVGVMAIKNALIKHLAHFKTIIQLIHQPGTLEQKRLSLLNTVQQSLSSIEEQKIRARLCQKYTEIFKGFNFSADFIEKVHECVGVPVSLP